MTHETHTAHEVQETCKQARMIASLFINPDLDRFRPAGPLSRSANHLNADVPMLLATLSGENPQEHASAHVRALASMSIEDRETEMMRNWQSLRSIVAWNTPHLDHDQQLYYGLSSDKSLENVEPSFISMMRQARQIEEAGQEDQMVVTRVLPSSRPRDAQPDEEVSHGVIVRGAQVHYLVEMNDLEKGEVFQPREVAGIAGDTIKSVWGGIDEALIETPHNAVAGRFYTRSLRDDRAGPVLLTGIPEQTHASPQEAVAAVGAVNLYLAQHEWAGRPREEGARIMMHEPVVQRDVLTLARQAETQAISQLGY